MSGKPIVRDSSMVLLNTTSLYGVGSKQYNRIKIPMKEIGTDSDKFIEYKQLGYSEGYGSFHFSSNTIKLGSIVSGRQNGNKRVNSIFGEGANPLIRKLRDAMFYLKLESNPILNHMNKRIVYGIALAENFREVLMGYSCKPKYMIPQSNPKKRTNLIAEYWIKRWLKNRIKNQDVLNKLIEHTLAYPVKHGARVNLENKEEYFPLFNKD